MVGQTFASPGAMGSLMTNKKITKSSGNAFSDLGFSDRDAALLKLAERRLADIQSGKTKTIPLDKLVDKYHLKDLKKCQDNINS